MLELYRCLATPFKLGLQSNISLTLVVFFFLCFQKQHLEISHNSRINFLLGPVFFDPHYFKAETLQFRYHRCLTP